MRFLLSNIADANFSEVNGKYVFQSSFQSAPLALSNYMGLELTELSLTGSLDQNRDAALYAFRKNANAMQHLPLAVHAPFSELFCHAIERRVVEIAQEMFSDTYCLAEEVGAEVMVVHTNHIASIYHPDWLVEHTISFWKEFLSHHPGKAVVTLENTIDETPELMTLIAQGADDPRLGICLDMGHANLSGIPVEQWIRQMAPYIKHYHIHNNDGIHKGVLWFPSDNHGALGEGSLDMEHLLHLAEELTPDATVTLETSAVEPSIQWLKDKHFI